jgi:hypothetical protein
MTQTDAEATSTVAAMTAALSSQGRTDPPGFRVVSGRAGFAAAAALASGAGAPWPGAMKTLPQYPHVTRADDFPGICNADRQ